MNLDINNGAKDNDDAEEGKNGKDTTAAKR